MKTPYEFYKEIHPEQFSDSKKGSKTQLSKEMFDYFLESLTSKNLEKNFEVFCRQLAEREICPNLIIQTGPTGGGDSKVDTETYPVSDSTALSWYCGIGREAAHERWAFAISAKREWKSKVKSDIKKIIETDRGYKRIFFMSNQYIADKKRADTEDELKEQYGIDINILDRNWIINKVFDGRHEAIAIETLGLSPKFLEEQEEGSADLRKRKRLDYIETKIKNVITSSIEYEMLPKLAIKAAILSRELELPIYITRGRFERAANLTKQFGTIAQMKECLYQWAWCSYWWHMDFDDFYIRYCNYESYIEGNANVYDIERLTSLWMNLFTCVEGDETKRNFKAHTAVLQQEYESIILNNLRPNAALQAKANYVNVKLFLGGDIDELVEELIDIIKEVQKSLHFDFLTLKRIIMGIPLYKKAEKYDALFELLIAISGERKQELETAKLLIERSEEIINDKPYSAIRYLGRAIPKLVKEEAKSALGRALLLMAKCFENIELNWAARGYYLNSFHISINDYFEYGELSPSLIGSLNALKYIEMKQGRIIHSIEFHKLEQIALRLYLALNPDSNIRQFINKENNYDFIMGIQMFRTNFLDLPHLGHLPNYLDENGLEYSAIAMKHCLGYEAPELIKCFEGNIDALDDFINKWYNQPARQQLNSIPWYGINNFYNLKSRIIGCEIKVKSELSFPCIEISESILAAIESFLSTGTIDNLISFIPEINLIVKSTSDDKFKLEIHKNEDSYEQEYIITCSNFPDENTVEIQFKIKEFISDAIIEIMGSLINIDLSGKTLTQMISRDNAFDRAINFTGSTSAVFEYFEKKTPCYITIRKKDEPVYQLRRESPLSIVDQWQVKEGSVVDSESKKRSNITYGEQPKIDLNIERTKQSDIHTLKLINIPLWDKAKWKGVFFLRAAANEKPPLLAPIFANPDAGQAIFQEWIKMVGRIDYEDVIKVGVIKGIDKFNPYHYRVIFAPDIDQLTSDSVGSMSLVLVQARLHTMEATTNQNVNGFIESYKATGKYFICPSQILSGGQVKISEEVSIMKNNLEVSDAWSVDENSFLSFAIMPEDEPIIPSGVTDAPILKVLERRKFFYNKFRKFKNASS